MSDARTPIGSARRATLLGVLCLISIAAFVDRITLSVALTDRPFKAFFHLDDVDRGFLNSAFFWTYAALQIPAGWLVDRFGAKRTLTVGFVLWSLVAAGTGMVHSFAQLLVMRLFLGVGEAVVTPAGMRWIRAHFPEQRRGLAIGIFMAAAKVGPAIGNVVAPLLILAYGWRPMFMLLGFGALVAVVPWLWLASDDHPAVGPRRTSAPRAPMMGALLRSPVLWGTLVGTFCYQYFNYFCMTWMQAYFVEQRHLSMKAMGLYGGISYAGFALVAVLAGYAADRLIARGGDPVDVRRRFAMAGLVLASTEIIGALSSSLSVALFFAVFSLVALGLSTANYWALTQTLLPGAGVGRIVGIQNFAANLPGIVAPMLTGWLKHRTGNYEAAMAVAAAFLVMGVLSYRFLVRREYAPRALA